MKHYNDMLQSLHNKMHKHLLLMHAFEESYHYRMTIVHNKGEIKHVGFVVAQDVYVLSLE